MADVEIGGLHRIAYDRRPPASRMSRKAEGTYGHVEMLETRDHRPVPSPREIVEPANRDIQLPQRFHQRVRIHWRDFLGV